MGEALAEAQLAATRGERPIAAVAVVNEAMVARAHDRVRVRVDEGLREGPAGGRIGDAGSDGLERTAGGIDRRTRRGSLRPRTHGCAP